MFINRQTVKREQADRRTDKQAYRQCKGQQTETDSAKDRQMGKHSKVIDAHSGRMGVLFICSLSHHVVCALSVGVCSKHIHSVYPN